MSKLPNSQEVAKEVNRLTLRIAILRYDLRERLMYATSMHSAIPIMQEICILQEQKLLIQQGNFHLLPYSVRCLYS